MQFRGTLTLPAILLINSFLSAAPSLMETIDIDAMAQGLERLLIQGASITDT